MWTHWEEELRGLVPLPVHLWDPYRRFRFKWGERGKQNQTVLVQVWSSFSGLLSFLQGVLTTSWNQHVKSLYWRHQSSAFSLSQGGTPGKTPGSWGAIESVVFVPARMVYRSAYEFPTAWSGVQLGNTCHWGSPSHAAWLSSAYVPASSCEALTPHRPHLRANSLSSLLPQFPFQCLPLLKLQKEREFIVAQYSTELLEANRSLFSSQVQSSVIPNVSFTYLKPKVLLNVSFISSTNMVSNCMGFFTARYVELTFFLTVPCLPSGRMRSALLSHPVSPSLSRC